MDEEIDFGFVAIFVSVSSGGVAIEDVMGNESI
jgi:hypothetical protein